MDSKSFPAQILNKYSNCASYRDAGYVEWLESDKQLSKISFETYYKRPCLIKLVLKFEKPGEPEHITTIIGNNEEANSYNDGKKFATEPTAHCLAVTAGISSFISVLIPSLLLHPQVLLSPGLVSGLDSPVFEESATDPNKVQIVVSMRKALKCKLLVAKEDHSISCIELVPANDSLLSGKICKIAISNQVFDVQIDETTFENPN